MVQRLLTYMVCVCVRVCVLAHDGCSCGVRDVYVLCVCARCVCVRACAWVVFVTAESKYSPLKLGIGLALGFLVVIILVVIFLCIRRRKRPDVAGKKEGNLYTAWTVTKHQRQRYE